MAKKDFSSVKTADAQKLVVKFQEMLSSPTYTAKKFPETRLRILLDITDSVRKYSEYLLRSGGYSLYVFKMKHLSSILNSSTSNFACSWSPFRIYTAVYLVKLYFVPFHVFRSIGRSPREILRDLHKSRYSVTR